jgi:hypothetical protein
LSNTVFRGFWVSIRITALLAVPALAVGVPGASEPLYLLLCAGALLALSIVFRDRFGSRAEAGRR